MAALLTGLCLAACGGSDKRKENELTGTLQAGGVAGVRYETATRSGQTDSKGTFRYLAGESVKFSVGVIELGSATGAPEITTFTLAGGTPPTTELALRRDLERSLRGKTALGRAINIQRLFILLDADNNPANGMDVASQAGALKNTIDLDARPGSFASQAAKLAPNLTQNVPISTPLVLLYRALGIQVPVHVETAAETNFSVVVLPSSKMTAFASYTLEGRRDTQGTDSDGDGQPDAVNRWKYDVLGRVSERSSAYSSLFGTGLQGIRFTYEYGPRGALLGGVDERDEDGDGLADLRYRHDLTPDAYGFALNEAVTIDAGADGIIDSRQTLTNVFDARHNYEHQEVVYDFDNDSINDGKALVDANYDAQDRLLDVEYQYDHDGDGIVDMVSTESYEYGSGPGATAQVSETDFDADGIVDSRQVISSEYDRDGYLLHQVLELDDGIAGADGVIDLRQVTDLRWDAQHRMDAQTSRVDYDGDGNFESVTRAGYTWDGAGNPLTVTIEADDGEDGLPDAGNKTIYVYGANGEMAGATQQLYSSFESNYRDFASSTVTTTAMTDGVTALAQQYLDGFGPMPLFGGNYLGVPPPPPF